MVVAVVSSVHALHTMTLLYVVYSLLPALNSLLDKTSHLGVRVAVGQAVALLFELVREVDESLLDTRDSDRAYELIQSLATESDRHTARKERNHQRSTFKDILNTLEVCSDVTDTIS